MRPDRFKDKAKGHAWVGIGKIPMHHFSTLVLKLAHKDSGFGDLRFLGVDDTNETQMRPYLKIDGTRAAYAEMIDAVEHKVIEAAGQ